MSNKNRYREYFDINERYFPCIDDAAISAGAPWDNTYPHTSFIKILTEMERALSRQNNGKTLWIEGAYGTGKSQCAYALRKILEVPEAELRAYWQMFEPLQKKGDLLEKLIAHKKNGIVVAHRYASGSIRSARDLFFAIQESIKAALVQQDVPYKGEDTLKERIIAWLDDADHKLMFDSLLQNKDKEWKALFSQSTADEVLNTLRKGGEVKSLVNNIFRLADKEGITALTIDSNRLIAWLSDIIDRNDIKIVLIWDEFSDYFKNNRETLSEFQKIVSLAQDKPFYFIVVAHEGGHMFVSKDDSDWKKIRDRFTKEEITLPENIAFNLIGHAFTVKSSASADWNILVDGDLGSQTSSARVAVMKEANIDDQRVMKDIMPIHPMAALILKNIAAAFASNQRSMFDFIKTSNSDDVKAFQWFIDNTGPLDDHPLLTVDLLWDFFYEKGKDNLTPDIRLILDTFGQQPNLRDDEKSVLKAILIMQAIDQRLRGTREIFKATDQNLSYVFAGISSDLDVSCKNIAKGLRDKGILVAHPIGGGRHAYAAAVLAGDQAKIDKHKEDVKNKSTAAKLVAEGGLANVLPLSPALRLRFESEPGTGKITPVTIDDFTRIINGLREKSAGWNFHAVIAFAKDESEAATFRQKLRNTVRNKDYQNIVFIDALSTPLGTEAFQQYVEYSAMAMYYQGNSNGASKENADKAKRVLEQDWKNRIYNGQVVVYTFANQDGAKLSCAQDIASILQSVVKAKFEYVFDFAKGLTESQLKMTNMKQSAKSGIVQTTSGAVVGLEKHVLPAVWKMDRYWENPATADLPISKIKVAVDELIETSFARDGQISIGEIYNYLEDDHGFAPCNLSAFIAGFVLKEYGSEPFRYSDSSGSHEPMTQDKLAEMLGNYIGKSVKPTYIVKMTAEEKAFYELTEKAWGITTNSCSSVGQAAIAVAGKMRGFGLPVWCLEEVETAGGFDVIQKYIELVQKEGNEAHQKAVEIGKMTLLTPTLADSLLELLTSEMCQKGMRKYLARFEDGKIIELATTIGAEDNMLTDIRRLFEVKYSCLWDKQTGDGEIRKLITQYGIVRETNIILNTNTHSLVESFKEWRSRLKFIGVSHDALRSKYPNIEKVLDALLRIFKQEELLPEQLKVFYLELIAHNNEIREVLNNDRVVFADVYQPYLEDLSVNDIAEVKSKLQMSLFDLPKTNGNIKVKEVVEEFRKNQLKSQLFNIWKDKTGTKNPREWSNKHKLPILCCVVDSEYEQAKKAFETLNRNWGTDAEIRAAISFLESTTLFDVIVDDAKRTAAFKRDIIGEYSALLTDIDKVRDTLDRISVDIYDWRESPSVKGKIKQLAEAEYNAGGSDRVLLKIDDMNDAQLKQYLKRLIKDSMKVGIEILSNESGG